MTTTTPENGPAIEALPAAPEGRDTGDYSISMLRANILGVPLFMAMAAAAVLPWFAIHGLPAFVLGVNRFVRLEVFLPWIAAGTLAHEGLHGLGWVAAGHRTFRSVRFGFHWKTLTPYAHFTEPITVRAYRVGIVLPGLVVGALPVLIGYGVPNAALVLFGGMFFGAAAGDALGLWAVRKLPPGTLVLDHPSRVGCTIAELSNAPDTTNIANTANPANAAGTDSSPSPTTEGSPPC